MVQRVAAGRPVAHVAAEMGVSRTTACRWWRHYLQVGQAGLVDRSARPHSCPYRTGACVEARIRTGDTWPTEARWTLPAGSECRPRPWAGSWPATTPRSWPSATRPPDR
ncbi:helix-turn-helix domain-containing protein [Cellulosimicrobium funkei]|uniref:helix-turn-helix domain-containing protein n=1 Tax=Cellulosimicrobium funkei TaxID=264251 RepID=UPI003C6CE458